MGCVVKANFNRTTTDGRPGGSAILDVVQDFIKQAFDRLGDVVTNSKLIDGVSFAINQAGAIPDVKVTHGLGSAWRTWEIVDKNADANVWRSSTPNPQPEKFLILSASGPVTLKLRVS